MYVCNIVSGRKVIYIAKWVKESRVQEIINEMYQNEETKGQKNTELLTGNPELLG